jgi:hypothetical protein
MPTTAEQDEHVTETEAKPTGSEGACPLPGKSRGMCGNHYAADYRRRKIGGTSNRQGDNLERHWDLDSRLDERVAQVIRPREEIAERLDEVA